MKDNALNAVLRIFDNGCESVAVYYVDRILDELLFVGVWKPAKAAALAEKFSRSFGFDGYQLEIVRLRTAQAA